MKVKYKCRKCRHILFSEKEACNAHGISFSMQPNETKFLETCKQNAEICYIKDDEFLPWMKEQVETADWMRGKLFCPTCSSRVGSFDFVGGSKCQCGLHVLPSLHVVSSKIDREPMICS
ncbi:hypothetical protein AVEN_210952-1 [Araneus ventricosus]|uniref:E3 ubiquitin-protein ligase RNF180 n=1 Tax=Araneus ventricosus TaxID=182803 RepID=A0A4Y2DIC0_ARAVE|nr:hypothetical protein AVEN_210952-1 [Araneus ventricosus]